MLPDTDSRVASNGHPPAARSRSASPSGESQGEPRPQLPASAATRLAKTARRRSLASLWDNWADVERPLRWGLMATGASEEHRQRIAALADLAAGKSSAAGFDPDEEAARAVLALRRSELPLDRIAEAVAWGYALPELRSRMNEEGWNELLAALLSLQRSAIEESATESPARLMGGGELGLVLAWRLADLPACAALADSAVTASMQWYDAGAEAVTAALEPAGLYARLTLAAALRTARLLRKVTKRRVPVARLGAAIDLAGWVAALTRPDGTASLTPAAQTDPDDAGAGGVLAAAAQELRDRPLRQATSAVIDRARSHGRLAWQVQLPEAGWNDAEAQIAALLPEWDVRRGRVVVDYHRDTMQLEVQGGRPEVLAGPWTVALHHQDKPLDPLGPWEEVSWFSDDDLHYLELEQRWTGGVRLQRQIVVLREDGCLLLADAVLTPGEEPVRYEATLPLAAGITATEEAETREVWLGDHKQRALLMPLGLDEWRVGSSPGRLSVEPPQAAKRSRKKTGAAAEAADRQPPGTAMLRMTVQGHGRLYAPLWCDFDRRRMRRERTWRRLTVAEQLRIVGSDEAVGYRVQAGHDQWLVYRSLNGPRNRTVLGKNLVGEFLLGRFEASDGVVDSLVTVEETDE